MCLQNTFHINVMNDVSNFYLDGGGLSYPCKKVRGFCPEGVLSYNRPSHTMPVDIEHHCGIVSWTISWAEVPNTLDPMKLVFNPVKY